MDKKKFTIINESVRRNATYFLNRIPLAPVYEVVIQPADKRSLDQNAKLHAIISDIAKQVEHHGQQFNVIVWKRLLIAAYLREIRESPMLVPAIDGQGIDIIYERSAKMSKKKVSGLIEFCFCFGAEKGVEWARGASDA